MAVTERTATTKSTVFRMGDASEILDAAESEKWLPGQQVFAYPTIIQVAANDSSRVADRALTSVGVSCFLPTNLASARKLPPTEEPGATDSTRIRVSTCLGAAFTNSTFHKEARRYGEPEVGFADS